MKIYHHNDFDGRTAGYFAYKWATTIGKQCGLDCKPSDLIETTYNKPFDKHSPGEDLVMIVDLSFTKDNIIELINLTATVQKVIWIDHHKSSVLAVESVKELLDAKCNLIRFVDVTVSSALQMKVYLEMDLDIKRLLPDYDPTYAYGTVYINNHFFKGTDTPRQCFDISDNRMKNVTYHHFYYDSPLEFFANLASDYDTFAALTPLSRYLSTAFLNERLVIRDENGEQYINEMYIRSDEGYDAPNDHKHIGSQIYIYNYINTGMELVNFQEATWRREKSSIFFRNLVDDTNGNIFKVAFRNANGNSYQFMEYYDECDAVCRFSFNGENWLYSIFTRKDSKVNAMKIAEYYGGGGHIHAAGFQRCNPVMLDDHDYHFNCSITVTEEDEA